MVIYTTTKNEGGRSFVDCHICAQDDGSQARKASERGRNSRGVESRLVPRRARREVAAEGVARHLHLLPVARVLQPWVVLVAEELEARREVPHARREIALERSRRRVLQRGPVVVARLDRGVVRQELPAGCGLQRAHH